MLRCGLASQHRDRHVFSASHLGVVGGGVFGEYPPLLVGAEEEAERDVRRRREDGEDAGGAHPAGAGRGGRGLDKVHELQPVPPNRQKFWAGSLCSDVGEMERGEHGQVEKVEVSTAEVGT